MILTGQFHLYADPGKPEVYLGCGIPVIITKVPEVTFEISKREAGIAINYDSHELSNAINTLLNNDILYEKYRENARRFASEICWNVVFIQGLSKLLVKCLFSHE